MVLAQELQPGDALLLIRPQHVLERAERWTFQFGLPALPRRALAPGRRRLDLPARLLPEGGIEKSRLHITESVALLVLPRRAVAQHFVELLQRPGVNQSNAPVLQARVAGAGQNQTLDVRRRKFFAVGRSH